MGLVLFGLCSVREGFTLQLPTQYIVAPIGKSDPTFDFKADIFVGKDIGYEID